MSGYVGDEGLAALMARDAARVSIEELRPLIRGVQAAPPRRDPTLWCSLVAPKPSPELIEQLQALAAEISAAAPPAQADHARRLKAVREGMARLGIDAFLVPHGDEFQNEYLPAYTERLAWLTGFTGSAGTAIVLASSAAIFVDGRYTVQVRAQTDASLWAPHHLIEDPPEDWLGRTLLPGQVLGYDSWLVTPAQVDRLRGPVEAAGARLHAVAWNPLDQAWIGRPAAPLGVVRPQPLDFAGKSAADKRAEIGATLAKAKRAAAVITAADSIAWLLNIRGGDVPRTPLALSYATIDDQGRVDLFIDRRKLAPGLESHLGNGVAVRPVEDLGAALDALAGSTVQVDPATVPAWIADRLTKAGAKLAQAVDPVTLPKALKNPIELEGMREAHRRDGVAMTRFMAWLDAAAPKGGLTEIGVADELERFRAESGKLEDLSFDSISAAGPNAALPHYHPDPESNLAIPEDSLYLIDSGAQYLDGTTDITRTVAIGTPNAEMRDRYTRVLKGHIALARAVFPMGTTGSQLDVLARHALWQVGVNYDHGTGHGIGCYLGVHEGPQRIAAVPNTQKLLPGMVISNEPGCYKPGCYGIRIENLVIVTPVEIQGAEREMLGFETITLCPIDTRPIERHLLDDAEVTWLDAYHAKVRETLTPRLTDPAVIGWLEAATRPLGGLPKQI
jgi:Xaa-Pro aminopeptidase